MEDLDELLELLEAHLTDADIELKFGSPDGEDEPEEAEVDDAEEPDEELDDDDADDDDAEVEETSDEDF